MIETSRMDLSMTKTRTSKSIREDKLGITFVGVNKSSVVYARTCEKEFRPLTFSAYAFAAYMYIYIYIHVIR